MHGPINVKSPNNTIKWQMGFNSAFKGLNEAQHVPGNTQPIIRGLKLHKQPLVLHTWKVFGRVVVGRCQVAHESAVTWLHFHTLPGNVQQLHVWQPCTVLCKTRSCSCSFRLLMMGGVSPETRWVLFKYGIIKFDMLLHLAGFFSKNFFNHVTGLTGPRFNLDFSDFIRSNGSCIGLVNGLRKSFLTRSSRHFKSWNFFSSYVALVGIFTSKVFMHGHKTSLNITSVAESYTGLAY
jgi:hypothetical protein